MCLGEVDVAEVHPSQVYIMSMGCTGVWYQHHSIPPSPCCDECGMGFGMVFDKNAIFSVLLMAWVILCISLTETKMRNQQKQKLPVRMKNKATETN